MSGPDGDADLAAEDMLKRIEQEEARAMRDELLGLLQSDVCRNALDEMMRRPMETALGNALNGPAMQAKIRELIAAALKPEIKSAIETATAEALKPLTVMLSPAQEQRLTNLGQKTIADAVTQSQTNAAGAIDTIGKTVTSLRDGLLKELREVKTAAALPAAALSTAGVPSTGMSTGTSAAGMPAAGSTEFAGAPVVKPAKGNWWNLEWRVTLSWRMVSLWLGGMAVVAILAYGLIAIVASIYRDPLTAAPSQSSSTTASLASTTPPASPDQPDTPSSPETAADEPSATEALPPAAAANLRAVVGRYLLEITKRGESLAPATAEQQQCVQSAMVKARSLRLQPLRAAMRGCLALEAAPAGATQVVAYVQQELNPHVASCPGMRTLTADGRGGQQTDGTIAAYLACTNLQASWSSPAIGDYVALGLHLAERHGR